jgi:UDP-N-acetylmuramoylalanine--D-glutamate ligase
VEISSQTKLFFSLSPAKIIGVTGTKGKGTTASLIEKILSASGKQVYLAGNIGRDPFEFLDQLTENDLVVMELSSFQLQDLEISPYIAVVLNITQDHLDHHKDLKEYIEAKSNIVAHQGKGDFAILSPHLPDWFKQTGQGKKIIIEPEKFQSWKTHLLGKHNFENIAAAATCAEVLEVEESVIKDAVAAFEPLPHRLRLIGNFHGINYIDDGYSTNPDPTMAAIDAVSNPTILIIGGRDKGFDFEELGKKIQTSPQLKGLVIIGETTERILKAVTGFQGKILTGARNMEEILKQARSLAEPGDTILFSPALASFDMFKNATDRAEQFVEAVMKLKA